MPRIHYAAITLGSNSFNMLVACSHKKSPQIIAKYKRKVRLADGVDLSGNLTDQAITNGLDCLAMFAQMLRKHRIDSQHITVIATATLRNANNTAEFNAKAELILGVPINVISGLQEAKLIYQGMIAHSKVKGRNLVIDIGGASTEFIIGDGNKILYKSSLPFGCVTFTHRFFTKMPYPLSPFTDVLAEVKSILSEPLSTLQKLGWQNTLGASGSVQSVIEILNYRNMPAVITEANLDMLRNEIISATDDSLSSIQGLTSERAPTFAAGIAILLALFNELEIKTLKLSGGALREGVLLELASKVDKL